MFGDLVHIQSAMFKQEYNDLLPIRVSERLKNGGRLLELLQHLLFVTAAIILSVLSRDDSHLVCLYV